MKTRISFAILFAFIYTLFYVNTEAAQNWQIIISKTALQDEAIKVAVSDLETTGAVYGIKFQVTKDIDFSAGPSIVIGAPKRNRKTADLVRRKKIALKGISDEQGFEIVTKKINGATVMIIAGGSVAGDVNGIYWLWDRIRVHKKIPDINSIRTPELKIRVAAANNEKEMRHALRRGITWVTGREINDVVPWDTEPEKSENDQNRIRFKKLIEYAHALHLKYLMYGDEFTYLPSLLREFNATLSPDNPAFWQAMQEKYRRLFQAMPELDGVMIRTGELTQVKGSFKAYDVMHGNKDRCDWSMEKRYRTFVKKMHKVVVAEFDKIYFQRTWVTNDYEQHSKAQVYRKIFTDDVPTKNLYLSPYVNADDRWFFTAYNPTFNQTPHNMVVLLAPMDYHATQGVKVFPTFPGQYFQAALQTILSDKNSNLKGAHFAFAGNDKWNTWNLTSYTAARLAWNHNENLHAILKDFCSIYFGREAADKMAEIYWLSAAAYKYGIYIEPATYDVFNKLLQLRITTFPVQGFPGIDHGKEHINFLHDLYLKCKPWMSETILYLDHGLEISAKMTEKFQSAKPLIKDKPLALDVENSLRLTHQLIRINNLYVKTFLAYFSYRENPDPAGKKKLAALNAELKSARKVFLATPGCTYKVFGIDQLIKNVEQVITDLSAAEETLNEAPTSAQILKTISEQQAKYAQVLKKYSGQAVKFLHWEGRIDGRDILLIQGDQFKMQHLRWDPGSCTASTFYHPLPQQTVTVLVDDIESRPIHPFILEQPNNRNNYTVKIYLFDQPGGTGSVKFDLYYIPVSADKLGLNVPW